MEKKNNLPWYSHPAKLLGKGRLVQSNKYPSLECKLWQAGPLHNPPFPILSIMRWSLILSAFIAVQSAFSFVCVALAIPPSSDRLEKRAPKGPKGAKISSAEYRKNSKEHPIAYHVEGLGPKGKLTENTKVRQENLDEGKRYDYGNNMLNTHGKKLHAGTFL